MNRVGVMVILWEPTLGLGIPDSFSLHIFHSSNVFKIFHTNIPPGDCVKGGREEETQFHSKLSHHKGGKQALSLEQKGKPAPRVGAFPGERFFLNISG